MKNWKSQCRGRLWARGHDLKTLGRGLGDATCQISKALAIQFQKADFFKKIFQWKLKRPHRGGICSPCVLIWTSLVEDHKVMPHPKYQRLDLTVSVKIFKNFLWKTDKPHFGGHLWFRGHNLNNLGRGPLGDATCQISKVWVLHLQEIFNRFSYEKLISPIAGAFVARCHNLNNLGRGT